MSWVHAICIPCWNKKNPNRQVTLGADVDAEICCICGETTKAGIYIHANPNSVKYSSINTDTPTVYFKDCRDVYSKVKEINHARHL